jgi:hypothetical protein
MAYGWEKSLNLSAGMNDFTAAAELNDTSCAHYVLFMRLFFEFCASCDNKQPGAEQVVCAVTCVYVI